MMLKRVMGKASFATLQDGSGRIQLFITPADVGAEAHEAFKHWDLGDIIAARGHAVPDEQGRAVGALHRTAAAVQGAASAAGKFHGLADQEQRYRQRYVDLIVTPEARQTSWRARKPCSRSASSWWSASFIEVETPMMHPIPGGAAARPFVTHHNALDMQMFLRIAPELYLKRLVVGGFERVFEINRNFRNEGHVDAAQPRVHDDGVLRGLRGLH